MSAHPAGNYRAVDSPLDPSREGELPLGGFLWVDTEGNDLGDQPRAAIAGVTVRLHDAAGREVACTVTDSSGSYRFDDLPIGDYTVVFTAPSGTTTCADGSVVEFPRSRLSVAASMDGFAGDRPPLPPIQTWSALPGQPACSLVDRPADAAEAGPAGRLRMAGTLG